MDFQIFDMLAPISLFLFMIVALKLGYDKKTIAFAPYGNYWRQLRKNCTLELFTIKRINSFRPIREEEFNILIKRIASANGSTCNLTMAVLSLSYGIISRAAFLQRPREFILLTEQVVKTSGGFNIGEFFPSAPWIQIVAGFKPELERLFIRNDQILQDIINEHKDHAKPKGKEGQGEVAEDMVDVLLKFQDMGGENQDASLTDDNIKAVIEKMFASGGETSANSINWTMAELMRNPRVMKKAQAEVREVFNMKGRVDETCINQMKYLKAVAKETMRLHPPVPLLFPRECGEACEIDGYHHIPVKSKVIVSAWAIGRDPKYWSEAERLYLERFFASSIDYKGTSFEFISFGAGRRICPGGSFGLVNVEVALAFLLYHFDWKLPNRMKTEDLDMTEQFGLTVKRKKDLYLIPSLAT
ncbi:Cytochrome P450 71D11 [Glycine soja]|uniref:Cytochrome P450 71D11 n=1 Tax=Glycine soja TaxID=3848 RepID=A0A0B2NPP4_GLYSO|nr:Cytochrome P450 71D11 [Glycine soja]